MTMPPSAANIPGVEVQSLQRLVRPGVWTSSWVEEKQDWCCLQLKLSHVSILIISWLLLVLPYRLEGALAVHEVQRAKDQPRLLILVALRP